MMFRNPIPLTGRIVQSLLEYISGWSIYELREYHDKRNPRNENNKNQRRAVPMTNKYFWKMIDNSKKNGAEQVEWLTQELVKKRTEEVIEFEIEFRNKLEQSYTSSLWGAAFVIMGGCSDDGFDYFRGWLISRGEEVFNQGVNNPEFLAEYFTEDNLEEDEFAPQLEEILSAASDAYTYQKTGSFEYNDDIYTEFLNELEARGYKFEPIDIEFDWEEEDLEERFPLLWDKFGEDPLT